MGTKTTARLSLVYPTEHTDPWFAVFEQMMRQLDAVGFAAREDRNLFIGGGGSMTWTTGTSSLTWDGAITVVSPLIGGVGSIASGSASLSDGDYLYVDVTRLASSNYSLSELVVAQVPGSDNALVLCRREGDKLVWRNGIVMDDGFDGTLASSLNTNVVDGLNAASSPSASNPYATVAQVSGSLCEDISSQANGSNTSFVTGGPYQASSLRVFLNGVHQGIPSTGHFVESDPLTGSFTMTLPPLGSDDLFVEYVPA